jgi:hypothetical protein
MHDELAARHRAITLRLAGRPIKAICAAVGCSEVCFHKWWRRYLLAGPEGLYDLTRANHVAQRISPELERTILSIRRRLQAHATPATRYCLIGATAIHAERKSLGVRPLPSERTIERVLRRNGMTAPRLRLAPLLPRQEWPGHKPAPPTNSTRSIWWGQSTYSAAATATTSGSARMSSTVPSACAWPTPVAWTRSLGSWANAGRTWALPSRRFAPGVGATAGRRRRFHRRKEH